MTKLKDILLKQIERSGPLTIAEYMTQCLLHPQYGYYTTHDPLGAKGDFITAPEISQMFGEMIGLCIAQSWLDQGAPECFTLAELGPGRGTLMADILRATKQVPRFHAAADITLLEASPRLQQVQQETLNGYSVRWVENVTQLPKQPLFLVANEFFDCLPIRQFIRTKTAWQEQMIGAKNGNLGFILAGETPDELLGTAPIGTVIETCPAALAITTDIAKTVSLYGGCATIIDYGNTPPQGDTFQAVQNHKKIDPLTNCGLADLTAHVDFQAIANAANTVAKSSPIIPQGVFLERLGITARARALATALTGTALENHITAHRRLTHPDEMGHLFKAISIVPSSAPLPSGFET